MDGLYHRTKRQLEAMDMTLEDYFESEGWKPDYDVFAIDHERDRDTPYSLKEWDAIVQEVNDKIEKERELIMKRRSTLMSANRQPELTRLFISSDSDSVVV